MDNTTIKRRAAVNAIAVLLRGLVQAASIIVLTPMLARYLGAHGFGLWSILYAFVP
jgi:O-antigen/teichoic acid export membrane protein